MRAYNSIKNIEKTLVINSKKQLQQHNKNFNLDINKIV